MKVTQSYLTLCDPMDYIVHGILQARILEWVPYPFSKASSWPWNRTGASFIAGGFFTNWAIREASIINSSVYIKCLINSSCYNKWLPSLYNSIPKEKTFNNHLPFFFLIGRRNKLMNIHLSGVKWLDML